MVETAALQKELLQLKVMEDEKIEKEVTELKKIKTILMSFLNDKLTKFNKNRNKLFDRDGCIVFSEDKQSQNNIL